MRIISQRKVHWGECSPSGAVFFPTYFKWFDEGTWALFESIGLPINELAAKYGVVGLPLSNCGADFRRSVRLSDDVELDSSIIEVGEDRIRIEHRVVAKGEDAVRGWELRFWGVKRDDGSDRLMRRAIPDDVVSKLRG